MKLFSLLCAAVVGTAILAPSSADARPHGGYGERTRVTYDRCGNPVHWVYTCVGHDRHGCPVYRWVPQSRGPSRGDYRRDYGYDYGYDRGPSRGHYDGHGSRYQPARSGVSFHWSR